YQAAAALRRAVTEAPAAEVRRTVRKLLDHLNQLILTPEQLRAVRAVEVLERIGTAEAGEALKQLAGGADECSPAPQAPAVVERPLFVRHHRGPAPAGRRVREHPPPAGAAPPTCPHGLCHAAGSRGRTGPGPGRTGAGLIFP